MINIHFRTQAIMEYMDGGALTEVISICQISEPQIACICKEVSGWSYFLCECILIEYGWVRC